MTNIDWLADAILKLKAPIKNYVLIVRPEKEIHARQTVAALPEGLTITVVVNPWVKEGMWYLLKDRPVWPPQTYEMPTPRNPRSPL